MYEEGQPDVLGSAHPTTSSLLECLKVVFG